jgi:hypothetical protein
VLENVTTVELDAAAKPPVKFFGSLVRDWPMAAAVALSAYAQVTVHAGGRRWQQEIIGSRVFGEPRDCGPARGVGSRLTCHLDETYFGPDTAITRDVHALRVIDKWRAEWVNSVGSLTIADLRSQTR